VTSREQKELVEGAALVGATLDPATLDRLGRFIDLLVVWNHRFRLTGDRDRGRLVRNHLVDALAVVLELPPAGLVVDLGSGAGFPGIVLGCARPDLPIRLIEPRRRPASFLSEAIRTIPLPAAQAVETRGEEAARDSALSGKSKRVVSRALRLDILVRLARPLLAPSGQVIAMQTPATDEAAARDVGRSSGLDLLRMRDYRLPGGESRRLLIFGCTT
jgi:16S rRNA (guanine527-N7)-methyltransferase